MNDIDNDAAKESLEEDTENVDLELRSDTLSALQEFYREQAVREEMQLSVASIKNSNIDRDIDWDEDWGLSQFWYDDDTANSLARECVRVVGEGGTVACISAPTLYIAIRQEENIVN